MRPFHSGLRATVACTVVATAATLLSQIAAAATLPPVTPESISPGLGTLGVWWANTWQWLLLAWQ